MRQEHIFDVSATPLRVWSLLSDLEGYSLWHPRYTFAGRPEKGANILFSWRVIGDRRVRSGVNITCFKKPNGLAWKLSIIDALGYFEESYEIEPIESGSRIRHTLVWGGLLGLVLRFTQRSMRETAQSHDAAFFSYLKKVSRSALHPNRHRRRSLNPMIRREAAND